MNIRAFVLSDDGGHIRDIPSGSTSNEVLQTDQMINSDDLQRILRKAERARELAERQRERALRNAERALRNAERARKNAARQQKKVPQQMDVPPEAQFNVIVHPAG